MTTASKTELPAPPLDSEAIAWLYELANSNFKAQTDLDESVWRSMSFVAALFALSVAVFRDVKPQLNFSAIWPDWIAGSLYVVGIACFVAAFGFLVWIVWEREFLHPAKDAEVKHYAVELTEWHRAKAKSRTGTGAKVVDELRLFMIDLLVNANDTNLRLIRGRLVGRSRAILLMLAGFAFICMSEAIMYASRS